MEHAVGTWALQVQEGPGGGDMERRGGSPSCLIGRRRQEPTHTWMCSRQALDPLGGIGGETAHALGCDLMSEAGPGLARNVRKTSQEHPGCTGRA